MNEIGQVEMIGCMTDRLLVYEGIKIETVSVMNGYTSLA